MRKSPEEIYQKVVEILKERKKIKLAELANIFHYRYNYFKYNILYPLMNLRYDIIIEKEIDGVEYVIFIDGGQQQ